MNNEFVLHPEKLDSLFYRAAMSALLKVRIHQCLNYRLQAKFKVLARQVDDIDRIIYTECAREAQTIIQKAKCLIRLMDAHKQSEDSSALGWYNEDNPIKVLLKAIMETNWSTLGNLLKLKPETVKIRRKRWVSPSKLNV
jgi:hypothetical protein